MKLVINLVTRNRPELCIETLERTLPNIALPNTTLMVSADHDDPKSIQALSLFCVDHKHLKLDVRKREDGYGEKYNRMLDIPGDVYMGMVDYSPILTPGFDKLILEAASTFPDGICGVVTDYLPNGSFSKLNASTRKLTEKMGYFFPPGFPYWFVDHWWIDVLQMINRLVHVPIRIESAKRPDTQDRRDVAFWAMYFDALKLRRRKQALEILASLDEPEYRKRASRSLIPLIEHRTELVNQGIRREAKFLEGTGSQGIPDEERYIRIKTKALEHMAELIPELQDEMTRIQENR